MTKIRTRNPSTLHNIKRNRALAKRKAKADALAERKALAAERRERIRMANILATLIV